MVEKKKHYCDRKLKIWATGTPLKSSKWTHVLRREKQFPRLNIIFGITSENSYSTIDSIVSSMNWGSLLYFFRQCLYNAMRVVLTWGLVTKISLLSHFSISERIGLEVLSRGFSISFRIQFCPFPPVFSGVYLILIVVKSAIKNHLLWKIISLECAMYVMTLMKMSCWVLPTRVICRKNVT